MLKSTDPVVPGTEHGVDVIVGLDDSEIEQAIALRQASLGEAEHAFIQARSRFDGERRRLRDLEAERQRRIAMREGRIDEVHTDPRPRKKRSTTGFDALLGRDGISADAAFSSFRFLSLQRQEIILNHAGSLDDQVLAFIDKDAGTLREARTFGEARALQAEGHTLGRPGVPLQRQAIWYAEGGKPGWLRLDQIFVERRAEGE